MKVLEIFGAFVLGGFLIQLSILLVTYRDQKWTPIYRDRCLILFAMFAVDFLIWRALK